MGSHVFAGFGFGPIQAGLFVKEAVDSGNFSRIYVCEIDKALIEAVRDNGNYYNLNIAGPTGIETARIGPVEMRDPNVDSDLKRLRKVLVESTEIVTSLPSVDFYNRGNISALIAEAIQQPDSTAKLIYTAENNNHAAEILAKSVAEKTAASKRDMQYLNTVIGKMSGVVTDRRQIETLALEPIAPGIERAFLVEQFNRILVSKAHLASLTPGIEVFIEKEDLLPFEEAKLYGHNAIHALLAYLGDLAGYEKMTELANDEKIMAIAREAFLNESGKALIKKYTSLGDELFTETGYREYAEDLLTRMTNPYLNDTVARAGRDPVRKLASNDRIFGTMTLALEQGVEPVNMSLGAAAGVINLIRNGREYGLPDQLRVEAKSLSADDIAALLKWVWKDQDCHRAAELTELTCRAYPAAVSMMK